MRYSEHERELSKRITHQGTLRLMVGNASPNWHTRGKEGQYFNIIWILQIYCKCWIWRQFNNDLPWQQTMKTTHQRSEVLKNKNWLPAREEPRVKTSRDWKKIWWRLWIWFTRRVFHRRICSCVAFIQVVSKSRNHRAGIWVELYLAVSVLRMKEVTFSRIKNLRLQLKMAHEMTFNYYYCYCHQYD